MKTNFSTDSQGHFQSRRQLMTLERGKATWSQLSAR